MSRWKPTRRAPASGVGNARLATPAEAGLVAAEAERLLRDGNAAEAEQLCRALLAAVPDQPTALMIVSAVCLAQSRLAEAEAVLRRGCAAHPRIVGFHSALGHLLFTANRHAEAVVPFENCVLLDPGTRTHRVTLVALYQSRVFTSFSEASRLAMLACLTDDTLTHSLLHRAWLSLVRLDPDAQAIFELFDRAQDYESFRARVSAALLRTLQEQPLFQSGLGRFLAADIAVERGLCFLRRWFLEHQSVARSLLPLLCQLSRYCYFSEYVFDETEIEDWSALRAESTTAEALALLGCYAPLDRHFGPEDLPRLWSISDQPCYRDLVRVLLEEPIEERRIRSGIPVLTPIVDPVSRAVRSQYEENPYPRWNTVGSSRDSGNHGIEPGRGKRILIAGSGTGREAVSAALTFPSAQIDAVDLSRASLAYGVRKASALGVLNLTFAQADILNLATFERQYHFISASGVLHHLRDPEAGLRVLLGLLAPRGVLRIGLYSRLAREAVARARAWIDEAGFLPTKDGIRAFRAAVIARPDSDSLRAWLTRSYDFYSLSQCRDLVFHVQERDFTLTEIASLLRSYELSVVRVEVKSPVHRALYRARFPEDPSATRLEHWAVLEAEHPAMFAGMYDLWLCRTAEQAEASALWLGLDTDTPAT